MLFHKLKFAIRLLFRSDIFTFLNIISLAVTICAILAIYLFVKTEITTDQDISQSENIFRIIRKVEAPNSSYKSPTLSGTFNELICLETGISTSDILRVYLDDELVSYKEKVFFESNVLYVDHNFFQILDYPLKFGDASYVLDKATSTVISERIAKKYFGEQNPIGEILEIEGKGSLEITGVLAETNSNSHLSIDFLVNNREMGYASKFLTDNASHAFTFYLKVPLRDKNAIENKLKILSEKYLNEGDYSPKESLQLQTLADIYFDEPMIFDIANHGSKSSSRTLVIIAVILLMVTSANFINLSIAKLTKGVRQTGIKKILGSSNNALIVDWALEVYLKILIATVIGIICCFLMLPLFSKYYTINLLLFDSKQIFIWLLVFPILLTSIIIIIPGSIFSQLNPFSALTGKMGQLKTNYVQHILLFFQFGVSFILIVFTIVIVRQFQFMQEKELGYNDAQVLVFDSNNKHSWKNKTHIQNAIKQLGEVADVTMVYGGVITSPTEAYSYKVKELSYQWNTAFVQPNFVDLLQLKIIDGNGFEDKINPEKNDVIVLNESAAKILGWPQKDIIGEFVLMKEENFAKRIIGIVQDYHYESFKNKIEPLVIQSTGWEETFVVKLQSKDYQNTLSKVENIWKSYVPEYPFAYRFLDASFQQIHLADTKNGNIIFFFTILTLIITSMGTLSLGAFIQQTKIKEITIRKVLGAPVYHIFYNLSASFLKVLLFSSVVALPATWIFATNWLSDFNYRISLSPFLFIGGFILIVTTVMGLVIVQSWKTATSNPINHLRLE